ncbi:putative Ammonium Transporter Family fused with BaeS Signal transduction histidine kinase [Vibrio nigripulchritudo SFn27]|nr:putative Ammonium Transporter Family fused with BaeS Signal transduction histidine kinase [Vibrio nigripulchritudo BLFn1]CCN88712.1 putative Ammonium Transporter Family fused with BaeS Signal transduction histidine kinase [Vibrio nigripulchritudo SFn27]CCN96085.1 putative Ammonium Transporter Family fused with BaeS Signal transduction histidine kinase [Vibrio nigripulchritudo ENn2]CCO42899.1 putative Ammonium Transporter Family fused with BaeS Signal transduction histidine kinase [Vibrio nigr
MFYTVISPSYKWCETMSEQNMWLTVCGIFLFFMQAGFLLLESGVTRHKNHVNVAAKNLADLILVTFFFWLIGYGLAFGATSNGLMGTDLFAPDISIGFPVSFLIFQSLFAATSVTIISGATAERLAFSKYLLIAAICGGIVYPIGAHWTWGSLIDPNNLGWLYKLGFRDFAGGAVVHVFGGATALALTLILGPRPNRFDGTHRHISGSSPAMATAGLMLLWLGWMGFNGGSNIYYDQTVPSIIMKTFLAGSVGGTVGFVASYFFLKHTNIQWVTVGVLSALVSITAGCIYFNTLESVIVSAMGASIGLVGKYYLEEWKVDDPVDAIPVHLFAGIFGLIAISFFGDKSLLNSGLTLPLQFLAQLGGSITYVVLGFVISGGIFFVINHFSPLRVSKEYEELGLDFSEHQITNQYHDMIEQLQSHSLVNEESPTKLQVEPLSDLAIIAEAYNHVVQRFKKEKALSDSYAERLRIQMNELRKVHDITQEKNKLSALNTMMQGIAHEVNTPLGNCVMCVDMLEQKLAMMGKGESDETSEMLKNNIQRVKDLIESCLEVSNVAATNESATFGSPVETIKTFMDFRHSDCTKQGISLTLDNNLPKGFETSYRANALVQVLSELVDNSIAHAFHDSDTVRSISISLYLRDDLYIQYQDTGKGISETHSKQVFSPFYSTARIKGHTGLGLNIAENLVSFSLEGKISHKGHSLFEIRIPIKEPEDLVA